MHVWNVAAYRLTLSDKLVDPHQLFTVVTNGKPSYSGPVKTELLIELSPRPAGKLVKDAHGYYAGYHQARGEYQQPPLHEDAAVLLFAGAMPKTTRLLAPNAGYNFGLAGLEVPLVVKGGQTLSLPLLLISVDRPPGGNLSLAKVLRGLKADLMALCAIPSG